MAVNTTFGQLKINFLRKAGNAYNANDATKLTMAGNCLNDALQGIWSEIKGHPYTLDTDNTINTTAGQGYVELIDTDILEIYDVTQKTTNSQLKWVPWAKYKQLVPNDSILKGVPEALWTSSQSVSVTGQSTWRIYFIPTPSAAIAIYYDYFKDPTMVGDSAFCPLPSVYDCWLEHEAKPIFYEMIDPKNNALIDRSLERAAQARLDYKRAILSQGVGYPQAASARESGPWIYKRVAATPPPGP